MTEHEQRVHNNIVGISEDETFQALSQQWMISAYEHEYTYNFTWLGRPIIQFPQDIHLVQELIWQIKPDLIIETGIAHGGSLILSASMLAMLDYTEAVAEGKVLDPKQSTRKVLGVDIDIREHNRKAIEAHPLFHKIDMIQGSSIDDDVVAEVKKHTEGKQKILVFLDSNHTHDHVLAELEQYAPLTSQGSYCVVWDTGVEDLPDGFCKDRPWGKGDNPRTAVDTYLKTLSTDSVLAQDGSPLEFELDRMIENKLSLTASIGGFLKRT